MSPSLCIKLLKEGVDAPKSLIAIFIKAFTKECEARCVNLADEMVAATGVSPLFISSI